MLADFTDIVVLLDRSGSMASIAEATRQAYNEFVQAQIAAPGQARFTLVQFSTPEDYFYTFQDMPLGAVRPLSYTDYSPNGWSTALRDAMGRLIDERGAYYSSLAEHLRPKRVLFVIQTDGYENSSRRFSVAQVRQRVQLQSQTYNWQFVYLGANQDAILTAQEYAIPALSSITYTANTLGTHNVIESLSNHTKLYRAAGETVCFTATDRLQATAGDEVQLNGTSTLVDSNGNPVVISGGTVASGGTK